MWLASHSSCPICRAPVAASDGKSASPAPAGNGGTDSSETAAVDGSPGLTVDGGRSAALLSETAIEISSSGDVVDQNVAMGSDCVASPSSSSSSSSSSFGCSLKRMLSRNKSENKVFPASRGNES